VLFVNEPPDGPATVCTLDVRGLGYAL